MRERPWHDAHTCVYTMCPRRSEAASKASRKPLCDQGCSGGWIMASLARTVLKVAAATAEPAATAGSSEPCAPPQAIRFRVDDNRGVSAAATYLLGAQQRPRRGGTHLPTREGTRAGVRRAEVRRGEEEL